MTATITFSLLEWRLFPGRPNKMQYKISNLNPEKNHTLPVTEGSCIRTKDLPWHKPSSIRNLLFSLPWLLLLLAPPAHAVTQTAWHSGLEQAGHNGRVILSSAYLGGRLMDELRVMKNEEATVEIRANIASSGVVWSSYARVCTTREALWRVHFPYDPATGELNAIGGYYMMANVSPTIAQALFDAMIGKKTGNPTTDIPGAVLIDRGEVPEC